MPATTTVAPVSPRLRVKAKMAPATMPALERGAVMVLKVVKEGAPSVLLACSYVMSTPWMTLTEERTM